MLPKSDLSQYAVCVSISFCTILYHLPFCEFDVQNTSGECLSDTEKSPFFCYRVVYYLLCCYSIFLQYLLGLARGRNRSGGSFWRRPPFFRRYTCVVYPFLEAVSRLLKGPFLVVLFGSQPQEPLNSLHFIKCHLCSVLWRAKVPHLYAKHPCLILTQEIVGHNSPCFFFL